MKLAQYDHLIHQNLFRSYENISKLIEIVRSFIKLMIDNAPDFRYSGFNCPYVGYHYYCILDDPIQ
jgi:hypothetical protein